MSLKLLITETRDEARRSGEKVKLLTMQSVLADIEKREKEGATPVELTEAELLAVLRKAVEKREDSAQTYEKAGALDRAEQERLEASYLSAMLPTMKSDEEVKALVTAFIEKEGLKGTGMRSMKLILEAFSGDQTITAKQISLVARELLT